LRVRVTVRPGCRVESIEERPDGPLLVKVRAPAREGRANDAVIAAVARHFGVPRSSVRVLRGHAGRSKILELPG
jgi:uncharacterized protein YggU (UPF0235/DUF167 family)